MIPSKSKTRIRHRTVVKLKEGVVEQCKRKMMIAGEEGCVSYSPQYHRATVEGSHDVDWVFGPSVSPLCLTVRDGATLTFTAEMPRLEVALQRDAVLIVKGKVPFVVVHRIDASASLDLSALRECRLLTPECYLGTIRRPAPPFVDSMDIASSICSLCCVDDSSPAKLMPCGHGDICSQCAVEWGQRSATCPFCRAPITSIFRYPIS